jgi:hypothetical protein
MLFLLIFLQLYYNLHNCYFIHLFSFNFYFLKKNPHVTILFVPFLFFLLQYNIFSFYSLLIFFHSHQNHSLRSPSTTNHFLVVNSSSVALSHSESYFMLVSYSLIFLFYYVVFNILYPS